MSNNQEYINQRDHIHSLDSDTLFAGCQALCSWLTDGDAEREPEKHKQPCPECGGEDRFRFAPDLERPSFFCNHCKPTGGWDGIALVEEFADAGELTHVEAVRLLAEATGYESECPPSRTERKQNRKLKPLPTFALMKDTYNCKPVLECRPEIDFATYQRVGAEGFGSGVAIPMFDNDGELSGYVRYFIDGAKKNSAGSKSGIVGVEARDALLSKRPVRMVIKTAGVSDCLVMSKMITDNGLEADCYVFTNGAGEMENPDKFEPILRPALEGRAVMVIQDNDATGEEGAVKWATGLAGYAADVRIVRLPQEWNGKPIKDLRDFVAAANNSSEVLDWINGAFEKANSERPCSTVVQKRAGSSQNSSEPPKHWRPFPLGTLPPKLRSFVIEVSRAIGIDSSFVAACCLSIISGVIGRTFWIEIKRGYIEPAMLWTMMLGAPGTAKTPALGHAAKPIIRLDNKAHDQYVQDIICYNAEQKESARQRRQKKSDNSESIPIPAQTPAKPMPIEKRLSVGDATLESIYLILAENPYGVILPDDELSGFFGGMDAYRKGKKDRAAFNKFYTGISLSVDRATGTPRHLRIKTPSIAIAGGVQPKILREIVKFDPGFFTSGFGARWLMVYPPRDMPALELDTVDQAVKDSYSNLLDELLKYRIDIAPDNSEIVQTTITLTGEAYALLASFQHTKVDEWHSISGDDNLQSAISKALSHCARLCLTLHVVECVENKISPTLPITPETMRQAIALAEWFLNEAHRIYAMLAKEEETTDTVGQLIIAIIRRCGGRARVQEFRNRSNRIRNKMKPGELEAKLEEMVNARILTVGVEKTEKNRDADYYRLANAMPDSSCEVNEDMSDGDGDDN